MPGIGVLLVNVGTPDSTEVPAVRRYLREFLSDPRVLDINPVARWMLLNLVILPRRPARSALAYEKIWGPMGSPLLVHGRALVSGLQVLLGEDYTVVLGHRYGNPSLESALDELDARGIDDIVIFPLYPQYAASSTGTSLAKIFEIVGGRWAVPRLHVVPPFYDDRGFLDAIETIGAPILEEFRPDHVLLSYHGLPVRHVTRCDRTGARCLRSSTCCDAIVEANRHCYRAQSYANARALATRLGIPDGAWTVGFQSRLGRTPWIEPHTDKLIAEMAQKGVKRLLVFAPSFVADCLETLEEIAMRAREDFLARGGEGLVLVPAVNASPRWIEAAADLVRRATPTTGRVVA